MIEIDKSPTFKNPKMKAEALDILSWEESYWELSQILEEDES